MLVLKDKKALKDQKVLLVLKVQVVLKEVKDHKVVEEILEDLVVLD